MLCERARIPGALPLGVDAALKAPRSMFVIEPAVFGALTGSFGLSLDSRVVVYDEGNSLAASRLWWVFQYYGHSKVHVLDGGWKAYLNGGHPGVAGPVQMPTPTAGLVPAINPAKLATVQSLSDSVTQKAESVQIIDGRTPFEYSGGDKFGNARHGHIPGAVNLTHTSFFSEGRLKPAAEIREMLSQAGINPRLPIVTYCQAGIRAAAVSLALEHAGCSSVATYDGSMAEWQNRADTAVVLD